MGNNRISACYLALFALLTAMESGCIDQTPLTPAKASEVRSAAFSRSDQKKLKLDGRKVEIRTYAKAKSTSSKRLIGRSHVVLSFDESSRRVVARPSQFLSSSRSGDLDNVVLPLTNELLDAIGDAWTTNANVQSGSARTDLGQDSLGLQVYYADTSDATKGVVARVVNKQNQTESVAFDWDGIPHLHVEFHYDGEDLTSATFHCFPDGVTEVIVEVDASGNMVTGENQLVGADALTVIPAGYTPALPNCALDATLAVAGLVGVGLVVYALAPEIESAVLVYRVARVTGGAIGAVSGMTRAGAIGRAFAASGKTLATLFAAAGGAVDLAQNRVNSFIENGCAN